MNNFKKRYLYTVQQNGYLIGLFKDLYKAQKLQLQLEYNNKGTNCEIVKIETDLIEGILENNED